MALNKRGGFFASEGKLAEAFERVERKLNLILRLLRQPLPMSDADRAAIDRELSDAE